jgi:replicative DNA helicase
MNEKGFGQRTFLDLVSLNYNSNHVYPVFDCAHNQDNSCRNVERTTGNIKLMTPDGSLPKFEGYQGNHKVCTACRFFGSKDRTGNHRFKASYWRESVTQAVLTKSEFMNRVKSFFKYSRGEGVLLTYPANKATMADISRGIQVLKDNTGFVADVIVLDYADIVKPGHNRRNKIEEINETWMDMKGMAEEEHCAFISCTQGNRESGESENTKANQVSGYIGKNDHVDGQFALSQNEAEKRWGVIRASTSLHRWQQFDESRQVFVLQNLELSQVLLDSAWV